MPNYFSKPENALTRAEELIKVDKKQSALEVLSDVMKSKKHRTWQKVHEDIMMLFVRLCVELKKSVQFKEVIHQYKNIVLQVNPKTLEDVVRYYLELARGKTEEARQQSQQAVDDVDDLDVLQTPEKLILSAVTGEGAQDRSDRTILTPWLKFLWESYRQCLDLLRNNAKFEKLYHDVAQQTYEFCLKYGRKTEFRKLCDILRHHLTKFHNQTTGNVTSTQTAVNLNNVETQAFHLDTRLKQLEHAMELELYMEAFKAVEDIWSLVTLSKKTPKPSLMANYYKKTALVFLKSGSQLFHAAALHKLFLLIREQKKTLSQEELRNLASRVLCATLAIPICHVRQHTDTLLESGEISSVVKQKQLANLLGIPNPPTRQSLVKDLVRHGIPQLVHPELSKLYVHIDVEFHPLKINERTQSAMEFIKKDDELLIYTEQMENILISKTILQVAQVYQSMGFKEFCRLCPYADSFRLERTLVTLVRDLELPIRLDHRRDALIFHACSDLGISQRENSPLAGSGGGPEQLASQLVTLSQALQKVLDIIKPPENTELAECRKYTVQAYHNSAVATQAKNLQRKAIIEARKEALERLAEEKEMEEESRRHKERRKQNELEEERLTRENEERERQRMEEEKARLKQKINRERYNIMKATDVGAKALENLSEEQIAELDPVELFQLQLRQTAKQAQEIQERARAQEKKFDYLTRAMRLEEIPLWAQNYEKESDLAKKLHEEHEVEKVQISKKEHARQLADRDRLSRMKKEVQDMLKKLRVKSDAEYKDKMTDYEKLLEEKRQERLAIRKVNRKEERKIEHLKLKRERLQKEKEEREAQEAARREQESTKWKPSFRNRDPVSAVPSKMDERSDDREGGPVSWRGQRDIHERKPESEAPPATTGKWVPRHLQNRDSGARDGPSESADREPIRRGGRLDDKRSEHTESTPWRRGGGPRDRDDERGGRFGGADRTPGRFERDGDDRRPAGRFDRDGDERPRPSASRFERDDDRRPAGRYDTEERPRPDRGSDEPWKRSGPLRDDKGPERGGEDAWRKPGPSREDRGTERGGEDSWRRTGPIRDDRGPDRRDDRGPRTPADDRKSDRQEGGWRGSRTGPPPQRAETTPRKPIREDKKEEGNENDPEGWVQVSAKKR